MKIMKDLKKSAEKYIGKEDELKAKTKATTGYLKEQAGHVKEATGGQVGALKKEGQRLKRIMQAKDVIIVKNDAIAILLRKVGKEDEFIDAFTKLTREGYRLVLLEQVRELPTGIGFNIQLGTLYHFQHVKYITQ